MNLLILNGPAFPALGWNSLYRGTYRAHPTYCDALPRDHEINRLFMWFLEEGGESGIVHDLAKACRYAELCNQHIPDRHFEVVEVTDGKTPANEELFLGFDLSAGYGSSLLWWGLKTTASVNKLASPLRALCDVVSLFFAPHLNNCGLFQDFEIASLCLRAMIALQSVHSGLYEGESLDIFEVVGVRLASDNRKRR